MASADSGSQRSEEERRKGSRNEKDTRISSYNPLNKPKNRLTSPQDKQNPPERAISEMTNRKVTNWQERTTNSHIERPCQRPIGTRVTRISLEKTSKMPKCDHGRSAKEKIAAVEGGWSQHRPLATAGQRGLCSFLYFQSRVLSTVCLSGILSRWQLSSWFERLTLWGARGERAILVLELLVSFLAGGVAGRDKAEQHLKTLLVHKAGLALYCGAQQTTNTSEIGFSVWFCSSKQTME